MAVIDIEEIWQGREGDDDTKVRTHTRVWRARTNDPLDDDVVVMAAVPVSPGDPHPSDAGAYAIRSNARQDATRLIWLITVTYSSEREIAPNPLDDPAVITWNGEPFQRPLVVDKDGKAVLNSAGDYFDPPIMRDDSRQLVNVVKNVGAVPGWILDYHDVVNSDTFTVDGVSVSPGKGKIKWIPIGEWQERNEIAYRVLTIQIHLDKRGWNFKPLDQGYRYILASIPTQRIRMPDANGASLTSPGLLNGTGQQLANPSPDNAVFLDFEGYDEVPFGILPLS